MSDKSPTASPSVPEARHRRRIRTDLERRGVPRDLASVAAERLACDAEGLSEEQYEASLDAAAVALAVRVADQEVRRSANPDIEEIQRLMQGFAGELRKLEEGLRILSAYALRMRSRATRDTTGTLH